MILYFANRTMDILGQASTNLPEGFVIIDDLKTEEVETGVATFSCKIGFDKDTREQLEAMTDSGNYILRKNGYETEFYTIIDTEIDTKNQEIYVYAEDAGLDLLNEIAEAYEATEAHTAAWYVEKWIKDSGFEIGINEIPASSTRKLSWDGESTVTERLASIATKFDGFEVSYSYDIKGTVITNKYVNIHAKRGKDNGAKLRLNYDIDRIVIKKSVANIATGLRVTGGTPEDSETPITLKGYSYDDGDFWVGSDGILRSRKANAKWSRYVWNKEPNKLDGYGGHIIRTYSYDTTSQATLLSHAIAELKSICDMEVNYEVDINKLPENIKIGDRIDIIDDAGGLYLSSRILLLETSVSENTQKATIGEHLIKADGISMKVQEMAAQFAESAKEAEKAKLLAEAAKNTATEAQTNASNAGTMAAAAQKTANTAQSIATSANETANTATATASAAKELANSSKTEATNAAKVATNYIDFAANKGLVIGDMTATTLGKNVLIDSASVNIRNGSTVLASFGAELIELGKNSANAVISFCGGNGNISFSKATYEVFDNSLKIKSEKCLELDSSESIVLVSKYNGSTAQLLIESHKISGITEYIELYPSVGALIHSDDFIDLYGEKDISLRTEYAIHIDASEGVALKNNQKICWEDANGTNREIFRLNNSTSDPTLILGDGLYSASIGAVNVSAGNAVRMLTSKERVILENSSDSAYSAHFRPYNDAKCTLGTAAKRWHTIYANNSAIQTSDRREKENIVPLGNVTHSFLFDKLQPVQYNFINGEKICYGLIAQDVIEAMHEIGIGEEALDLVHHEFWKDSETGETIESFGIAYTNLIALLIYEVQKLKKAVATLKEV